jgi:hypothetical protein
MIICDVCEYVKEETAVLLSVIIIISCKRIKNLNSFFFLNSESSVSVEGMLLLYSDVFI